MDCLTELVPQSECSLTDTVCLCTNEQLTEDTAACVLARCKIYEGLQTKNITMTMCGAPIRDKHMQPLVISLVGGSLAILAFIMRVLALLSKKIGRPAGVDDYLAGAAVLLSGPPTFTAFSCMAKYPYQMEHDEKRY